MRINIIIPTDYVLYFKFRGDAVNYGSLSYVTASYSGSSPNPNGTIAGKTCLTISTEGDYVYFPAFSISPTTPPPLHFSYGFWCNMQGNVCATNSIADRNFTSGTIWQGDVQLNEPDLLFQTFIAANTQWIVSFVNFIPSYSAGTWVHIFYTVQNATTFSIYVNGNLTATSNSGLGSFLDIGNYYMILGRAGDNSARYFQNCGMHDFLFYNRTLSQVEVNNIYTFTTQL